MSTNDMTCGNPSKHIIYFTLPLLIGNIFQQFYSLVDTLIVGRTLGVQALAAVGSTAAIAFLIMGFILGLTTGFSVMTAQKFGAQDYNGVRSSAAQSVYLCLFFTITITLLSVGLTIPLLKLLNTPDDIFSQAYNYIVVIYWGTGATIFYNMLSNIIRALGDSRTPLYFLILASIVNVILDLYFIINLNFGVAGAAWATVISQIISGVLCLQYMKKKFPILKMTKNDWKFDKNFALEHLKLGFPMGFQLSILTIGIIAIQSVLNSFGSISIAAFTAASRVEQLATQPIISLGVTIAAYSAQNFGAEHLSRIRTGVKRCLLYELIISVVLGTLIIIFAKPLISMFITGSQPQMLKLAQTYLYITVPFYYALGILIIYRSALQGMGNASIPFLSGVVELFMRVFAALIFAKLFGFAGVCFASPLAWLGAVVILNFGYYKTIKKLAVKLYSKSSSAFTVK